MVSSSDVFIAGAGPAGLAAAIAAASAGFSVQVAEALHPPLDKACGEGLMPQALESLAQLGVELPDAECFPFRGIRFIDSRHSAEAFFPHGAGRGIRRSSLSARMLARALALGVQFQWNSTIRALDRNEVITTTGRYRARWIVGADGHASAVRKLAGLDARRISSRRIGLRQHFRIAPWSEMVEVHWGERSQAYVTPVARDEICIAIVGRQCESFSSELQQFPRLIERLGAATPCDTVLGRATLQLRVRSVARENIALIGDASGAVDALTGEGLALSFRQAQELVKAMRASDLASYSRAHEEIFRLPRFISTSLLLLDRSAFLRCRTLRAFSLHPELFNSILRIHLGEQMPSVWGLAEILNLGAAVLLA
jgi:flavin-dependent dehydrogenase